MSTSPDAGDEPALDAGAETETRQRASRPVLVTQEGSAD